ncbi:zinc-finger homeodomain protein 2-like [Ziziphus jujuba]|uniref:Zinc-finger homeodomain protein 2-like n=1 Tax=Ziziphus jujuba TaxID=326968 RepID=A0ABM3IN29_ZIZJJ|nr:zinc-finger homeodomain protein 2-like [Ziziphus jujuba]
MDLSVVPYNHSSTKPDINDSEYGDVVEPKPLDINTTINNHNNDDPSPLSAFHIKYGECMRNHAASIGGHANDGCGEFMPRADDGSRDSLTCAACGCHRNFHRRELPGSDQHYSVHSPPPPPPPMLLYNAGPTTPRWDPKMVIRSQRHYHHQQHHYLHHRNRGRLIDHHDHHHEDVEEKEYDRRSETPEREEVQVQVQHVGPTSRTTSCKRSRTKFTQEQKNRMLAFAEKIGWRIQRHDDLALNQFCSEVGVKRNVLKVWMHNNKNAHRRRESVPPPPPLLPEAPPPQPPPPAPPQPVGV